MGSKAMPRYGVWEEEAEAVLSIDTQTLMF